MPSLEIRLLGAVEVLAGGSLVPAGQPRQRGVLATLAVDAGRLVSWDTLVYRVWGDSPPNGVRAALYSYVTRLRQVLGHDAVQRGQGGYTLCVDPEIVDLHRFRGLVERARAADDSRRAATFREAMALWRGDALSGISGLWAARMRDCWGQERMEATIAWAQAEQQAGRASVVIGPLAEALAENPLVEPLAMELMRALCAMGRRAEALECFATVRRRLIEELGAEPGPELRELHQQVLLDEATSASRPRTSHIPSQLPRNIASISGRAAELAALDALNPGAIVVIQGTAGIGKTTLAVHWGHSVAATFPDGQLYINLRGFDPGGRPLEAATALRGFLEALDVRQPRAPQDFDAQVALYRSLLAGKRMLVVLDNAHNAEQVRPLLPMTSGCMAVVTSRNHLPGLVVTEGAHPITLDLLSTNESLDVLAQRIGRARVDAEPEAAAEIVARCARLPLALAIVAARAATYPRLSLAALARELGDTRARLDALDTGDQLTQIRAVFSWSYAIVSSAAAHLFRLLGSHPGADVSLAAAASLADEPIADTRHLLAELTDAYLVSETAPERFSLHDLLKAYAAEQVQCVESEVERHDAMHRALDHYLRSAHAADRLLNPYRDSIALPAAQRGAVIAEHMDEDRAFEWLAAEHDVLLAVIGHVADTGWDAYTWRLGWVLAHYLFRRGHWLDQAETGRAALAAAERTGDACAQTLTGINLARAHLQLGENDQAQEYLEAALKLAERMGDPARQADAHHILSWVLDLKRRHTDAFAHAQEAYALFHACGHLTGQASALNTIGWFHTQLGNHEEALIFCQPALRLHEKTNHREGQAATWHSLGHAHHHLGNYDQALACYQRALEMFQELHNRYFEGNTLAGLGDTYEAIGNPAAARGTRRLALAILEDLNHPQAEGVRVKLALAGMRRPDLSDRLEGLLAGGR